jgi:hypothetical protein
MPLGLFHRLNNIDDWAKVSPADDRRTLGQSASLQYCDEIGVYPASAAVAYLMPREPFGQAINYMRNNIDTLRGHLHDGLVPMDNYDTDQMMKQVAVGRKT